jgi:FkbM family methyltransferase
VLCGIPISTSSKYHLCKTNQNIWLAVIENDLVSNCIECNSVWEQQVTDYLISNVKPSETIIEIGANVGYYTTLLAKLVGAGGRIYSYEANKDVYDLANLSLKMNELSKIVTIKNIAISDRKGVVEFSYLEPSAEANDIVNIGGGHISTENSICSGEKVKRVKAISLDEDLNDIKNVDWLRMDIEGSEILALKGAKRIIKSSPNLKIVMEWAPRMLKNYGNVSELIDEMHKYGFRFYKIPKHNVFGLPLSKEYLLGVGNLEDLVLIREK